MAKKRVKRVKKEKDRYPSALFIPAGLFIGMGFGFLYNELVAGMYIGLGAGFVLTVLAEFLKRK